MKKKRKQNNTVINVILGVLIILTICCNLWWPFNGVRPPDIVGDVVLYYDSDEETMILFRGGLEGEMGASRGLWKWNEAEWTPFPLPDGIPRYRNTAAYDRKNSRLIVVNGEVGSARAFKGGQWTPLPPSGPLGIVFYNPVAEQIWAGEDGAVYALNTEKDTWERVPEWLWPFAVYYEAPIYDVKENRAIVYALLPTRRDSLIRLCEVRRDGWEPLLPEEIGSPEAFSRSPPRLELGGMIYDGSRDRIVLLSDSLGREKSLRIHELVGGEIRDVTSENIAPYRSDPAFGYNPDTGEIMMYGGYTWGRFSRKYVHDTWSIKYVPERDVYVWRRLGEEYADLPNSTEIQRLADTLTQGLPPAKVEGPRSPPGLPPWGHD